MSALYPIANVGDAVAGARFDLLQIQRRGSVEESGPRIHGQSEYIVDRTFVDFAADDYFRSAVERQLEVLSEALNVAENQEPELRERFPEISEIVGLRNRIAHSYDRLNLRTVWDAVVEEVPTLIPRLEKELGAVELPDDFPD